MTPPAAAFSCPRCGKPFPMEDVNVSKDMALCRECGYSGPFLIIVHAAQSAGLSAVQLGSWIWAVSVASGVAGFWYWAVLVYPPRGMISRGSLVGY